MGDRKVFQTAKNKTGLHHYQVRGYTAWYRCITLSMAAAAFFDDSARSPRRSTAPSSCSLP